MVDSSGWLEYFNDSENTGFFVTAIEAVDELIIPRISLFEVFKRILIQRNRDDALKAIALMKAGEVVDIDGVRFIEKVVRSYLEQSASKAPAILTAGRFILFRRIFLWDQSELKCFHYLAKQENLPPSTQAHVD